MKKLIVATLAVVSNDVLLLLRSKRRIAIIIILLLSPAFAFALKADTSASSLPNDTYSLSIGTDKAGNTVGGFSLIQNHTWMTMESVNAFTRQFEAYKIQGTSFFRSVMALTHFNFLGPSGKTNRKASLTLKRTSVPVWDRRPGNLHYLAIALKVKF